MLTGEFIPVYAQLFNCDGGKFPLAHCFDDAGAELPASPVALSALANGLYGNNNTVVFPNNSEFVRIQVLVYDDAGHTILSPDQSSMSQVWKVQDQGFWFSTQIPTRVGDPIAMTFQTFDDSVDQFVRVFLRDENDAFLPASPVDLTPGANGLYTGETTMPQSRIVTAQYVVYSDSGYTTLSPDQSAALDEFALSGPVPDLPSVAFSATAMIGVLDSDACQENGIEDEVIQGADRQLYVRLLRKDNGEPFDLTYCTEIEARFRSVDDGVVSVKMSDSGNPIVILSMVLGKFVVTVNSSQTIQFSPGNPAPFSIVVTLAGGAKTIINFPYQLAIFEETP